MAPASSISSSHSLDHLINTDINLISSSLQTITPLDFEKLHSTLPPTHHWPTTTTTTSSINQTEAEAADNNNYSIPVIDLSKSNQLLKDQIKKATEEWGAFLVTNHGIPLKFLEDFESQIRRLYSLPTKTKLKALRQPNESFSTGYGMVPMSKFFPQKMWSEGFAIVGSPIDHALKLWPPHGSPEFCSVIEEYQIRIKALAENILTHILQILGLPETQISNWTKTPAQTKSDPYGATQSLLHLNSYPPCPDPDHTIGLAHHTDTSLLTIVYQNSTPGLQFHHHNNNWVNVPCIPGGLVVNVGDLMQVLSNGRFKSALHRVVVNRTQHRYTASYFYSPPRNVQVCPVVDMRPLYKSISWEEFLEIKAKHFNNALRVVRLEEDACDDVIDH